MFRRVSKKYAHATTPPRQPNRKWKHFFFSLCWKQTACSVSLFVSCIDTFPGLRDMRKGAVVNANFVVEAIYISKLLTFQSIIFQMPSGLCLSLDYLWEFFLLQTGWQIRLSLATGLQVSKWLIDLAFLPPPPPAHTFFFFPSLLGWYGDMQDNLRVWFCQ